VEKSSTVHDVKQTFRQLCEELAPCLPDDFSDDTDLTQGLLDSFALLVVLEHIEQAIGRELEDEERGRAVVRSLDTIAEFVDRERTGS
jgi:acyl carrier protein